MKKTAYIFLIVFSFLFLQNCEEDYLTPDLNYVTFEAPALDIGVDPAGSASQEVKIFASNVSGSERTISITVNADGTDADPSAYSVPTSVVIPANSNVGMFIVDVNGVGIDPDNGNTLALEFSSTDGMFAGEAITLNLAQVCPTPETFLDIVFDGYASEVTWEILDSSDAVIQSGGPWSDGDESFSAKFCLASGSYTFVVYDAYGDGLSYPANGTITITYNGNELVSIVGNYGYGTSQGFSI